MNVVAWEGRRVIQCGKGTLIWEEYRDRHFSSEMTQEYVRARKDLSLEVDVLLLVGVTFENVETFACLMRVMANSLQSLRFTNCNLHDLGYFEVLTEIFSPCRLKTLQIVEGNHLSPEPIRRVDPFSGPRARQVFRGLAQAVTESFRLQFFHEEDDYDAILGGLREGCEQQQNPLGIEASVRFLPQSMLETAQAIIDSAVVTDFCFADTNWSGATSRQAIPLLLQTPSLENLQIEEAPLYDFDNCTIDEGTSLIEALAHCRLKTLHIITHTDPGENCGETFFIYLFQALIHTECVLHRLCIVIDQPRYRKAITCLLQKYLPLMKNLRVLCISSCDESRPFLSKGIRDNESLTKVRQFVHKSACEINVRPLGVEGFLKRNDLMRETRDWCRAQFKQKSTISVEDLLVLFQHCKVASSKKKKSKNLSLPAIYELVREHVPQVAHQIKPLPSKWERIKKALSFWKRKDRKCKRQKQGQGK